MTRPMSANRQLVISLGLRGRRQTLWSAVQLWLRDLSQHLPLAWEGSTEAQWREAVFQELQRSDSRLDVHCLCEEEWVVEAVWRIVSDDEKRKEREALLQEIDTGIANLGPKIAAQAEHGGRD